MKALLTLAAGLSVCAGITAQQVVAKYDFENDDVVAATSSASTATDLSVSNTFVFGGPSSDSWLCLTTDWNDVGGTISWTVSPVPGQTLDFTRLSWKAVTGNPSISDSVDAVTVVVNGVVVETIDPLTHLTTHVIDLEGVPGTQRTMAPVTFELQFSGNPTGQSSYEIGEICVEAGACVENLAGQNRIIWIPTPGMSNYYRAIDGFKFVEHADGTATLAGAVVNLDDETKRISVDVTLTGRVESDETPPAGSPKTNNFIDNSDCDTSAWRYYTDFTGTLTGRLSLDGFAATIDRRGEAFQIGNCANMFEDCFGASGWFDMVISSQAPAGPTFTTDHGDFNFCLGSDCICLGGEEADWSNYGTGLAGCGGPTTFICSDDPLIGSDPDLFVGNGSPDDKTCCMIASTGAADLPILGGSILVSVPTVVDILFNNTAGGTTIDCPIPADPCQVGGCIFLQVICLDGCAPEGLSFSEGLKITIGDL